MATKTSIPAASVPATAGVDEKTPLLVSVSDDITSATSPVTTFSGATVSTTGTYAVNTAATASRQNVSATKATQRPISPLYRSPYLQQKVEEIELLLSQPEIDLWKLRGFALSPGGLVNDSIRKRAWPKLVGLDHNYDPLPLDDIIVGQNNDSSSLGKDISVACSQSQSQTVPTIEIDAHHELLKREDHKTESRLSSELQPASTLIAESMDIAQIDRDVARCTWHLLTGSQRSRRSQRRSISKNSKRGTQYQRFDSTGQIMNANSTGLKRIQRHQHSAKYRRNRKVTMLLKKKQTRLANLINLTLVQSYDRNDGSSVAPSGPNRLRYYQGYHDVACIFLHALGGAGSNQIQFTNNETDKFESESNRVYRHYPSGDLELPSKVLCQVSFSHFKDALRSDFLRLQTGLKLILFPLLSKIDREVHNHLLDADMEPFFCLSWILTWFAHDVRDTNLVKRLFDAFLVGHPTLPVYAALSMMTHPYNRQMIMETDCDFAALHQCLASLPKHSSKVGYKEQRMDGFDNIVTYVSDDEGGDSKREGEGASEDNLTISTNTESYLEEESEFDDSDSHTCETRSNYTNDTIYTESSFPISVDSNSQFSNTGMPSTIRNSAAINKTGGSLVTGSMANFQEDGGCGPLSCPTDRTMISTEDPDILSNECTLVSGNWNETWGSDVKRDVGGGISTSSIGDKGQKEKIDMFVTDDHNPVPFESVLDNALELMKNYPPSSLVTLAKAYYQEDWDSQLSLLSTSTHGDQESVDVQELIGLLQPNPPAWSIQTSCNSDWMDKQRQRQNMGLKPKSRKDRRRRKQKKSSPKKNSNNAVERILDSSTASKDANNLVSETDKNKLVEPMEYVLSNPEDRVVAAVGYGPGMEAKIRERKLLRERRRRRKRQRALLIGCSVVVIGALFMYGRHKMVVSSATADIPDDLEKPASRVRQLRADPSSEDKAKGSKRTATTSTQATTDVNSLRPTMNQKSLEESSLSLPSKSKNGDPVSPKRSNTKSSTTLPSAPTTPVLFKSGMNDLSTNSPSPLSISKSEVSVPSTRSNTESLSSTILPIMRTVTSLSQSSTVPILTSSLAQISQVASVDPSKINSQPSALANIKQSVLKDMVHKTRRFFERFAHHFWIACRGFVFPFKFLQHPKNKLEY